MRLMCAPEGFDFQEDGALNFHLFGRPEAATHLKSARGGGGAAALQKIKQAGFAPSARAWDFLSIALSVIAADTAGLRDKSADGWTRSFELTIAVIDPEFWSTEARALQSALQFLTTDQWQINFIAGGSQPKPPKPTTHPPQDSVTLLSGGLDSLIGAIDLSAQGKTPLAVSHIVRGDAQKQAEFAAGTGSGLKHFALNHVVVTPGPIENTQRARSIIFLAFGVIAATSLQRYHDGKEVPLYVCENGFIAINTPLTGARVGSLSTRTADPEFLNRLQGVLSASGLRVVIENPYRHTTKGEMMLNCSDQDRLRVLAPQSTSCGRFLHYNYKHCGRCIPCQIRRAAFLRWGERDSTYYVFPRLGKADDDHARFDDVRSASTAAAVVRVEGLDSWIGAALSYPLMGDRNPLRDMIGRGLAELARLHKTLGVK
jgi:queuosine biosynthesis protein QueC